MTKYVSKQAAIQAVIKQAYNYYGVIEGSTIHHEIIDYYNRQRPLPRNYAVKYTDAWCATFVTVVFTKVGLRDIIYPECGCQEMLSHMKTTKPIQSSIAKGNIVFYDWDGNKHADHVGIITQILENGKVVKVIEGNKNDSVDYRTIAVNSNQIQCIGLPDYAKCIVSSEETYARTGWVKDENGWWYAYDVIKGSYYKNTAKSIDGRLYLFDTEGYVVDGCESEFRKDGSIKTINGKRLAL